MGKKETFNLKLRGQKGFQREWLLMMKHKEDQRHDTSPYRRKQQQQKILK